ncbi:MAG: penicillin-binding protein 1A [Rhodospirillales bacterium]|nr:penicillin-binding protein 1A [Rhodospirillales bacterium]MSP80350.1 penicillin-binding protein 1A [Rhodospirillales bacterium]
MIRFLTTLLGLMVLVAAGGGALGLAGFYYFGQGLPDYRQLAVYEPPVMTRVHAGDGRLLAEYATEKRVFVPVGAMPKRVVEAFLSTEDKNFYAHPGIDLVGVARATIMNLRNWGEQRRPVGASTITQQVAKNFLLTNEVSIERKIKEAILSFRIEHAISKDRILELYLNKIYLGFGSYGVAAAALNYFNKSLDELTVAEAAFLAALPKAPNNYHPIRNPEAAKARRDWAIGRMTEDGVIGPEEARLARAEPLSVRRRDEIAFVGADYFAEEIRRDLVARYGEQRLYRGGLSVRSTLDSRLQEIADRTLRQGLEDYDRRHGWRGPIARLGTPPALLNPVSATPGGAGRQDNRPGAGDAAGSMVIGAFAPGAGAPFDPRAALEALEPPAGLHDRRLAVVTRLSEDSAEIALKGGGRGAIPLAELRWARAALKDARLGPVVQRTTDVLAVGDDVVVRPAAKDAQGRDYPPDSYALSQIPKVEGALVALDPHTGRVLAMTGGYDYKRSQFNRVTQANRQPGSAFKPFVYLAALDSGYTPSTLILDAPFVIDQGPGLPKWRPDNYTREFHGPSTMRLGVEKSRNLMTVRLAQTIGIDKVAEYAERFAVVDKMPHQLSMALGAAETTPLRLTAAYAMFVNGGKRIAPSLIDRIQDRHGRTVFRHDQRPCLDCQVMQWTERPVPALPDTRPAVTSPASAYQMVSMLQGAVERGTGRRVAEVGKPLAGKTGTTNDSMDGWFVGFSPDLVVGVFVGYDEPQTLGDKETGGSVAAPIFRDFMAAALEGKAAVPFRIPADIRLVRVNAQTGVPEARRGRDVIIEAFKPGTEPTGKSEVLEGFGIAGEPGAGGGRGGPETGTGGLY